MLRFALIAGLIVLAKGNVLNNCFTATGDTNVYLDKEKIFVYLNVANQDKDNFAINVVDTKNPKKLLFRLAVNCGANTAKVSRKVDGKKWKNLGERKKVPCSTGSMLVVISNSKFEGKNGNRISAVWVGDKQIPFKQQLKGVGELKLVSKTTTLLELGVGTSCVLYPKSVASCTEAEGWFDQHSDCYAPGFLGCITRPKCNGLKFAPVQQIDSSHAHCTSDEGEFTKGPDIDTFSLGSTVDTVCP